MLNSRFNYYWHTSLAKIVFFLLAPLVYGLISRRLTLKGLLGFSGGKKAVKFSLALGAATFFTIIAGYVALRGFFDRQTILSGLFEEGITKSSYPLVFLHIVFVNAFLEEFFFRGFVFLSLFRLGFKKYAFLFSSLLFALYHAAIMDSWFSPPMFALCLAGLGAAGLIFDELSRQGGGIYGGFFVHAGANLAINLIGAYLFYRT